MDLDDIVREFLVESYENLDRLDQALVALETRPADSAVTTTTTSDSSDETRDALLLCRVGERGRMAMVARLEEFPAGTITPMQTQLVSFTLGRLHFGVECATSRKCSAIRR